MPIAFTRQSLWAPALGAILLDLAVQAVHVTSLSMICQVRPDAGSRLIGSYMVFYSVGSGAGSIASTGVHALAGRPGVCVLGAAFSVLALIVAALPARTRRPRGPGGGPGGGPLTRP